MSQVDCDADEYGFYGNTSNDKPTIYGDVTTPTQ